MHTSIVDWIPPASTYGLPLNESTLAEKMNAAGYVSHAVGKVGRPGEEAGCMNCICCDVRVDIGFTWWRVSEATGG